MCVCGAVYIHVHVHTTNCPHTSIKLKISSTLSVRSNLTRSAKKRCSSVSWDAVTCKNSIAWIRQILSQARITQYFNIHIYCEQGYSELQ